MSENGYERDSRLLSLTIENFRGVRDRVTFDLDASVVLMWGPNGTGKTTFFDALLWLLQGSLPRLAAQTLRKNEDYVVNSYRRSSPATVTAIARLGHQDFEFTRRGFANENSLEVRPLAGSAIDQVNIPLEQLLLGPTSLSLDEVIATSGLLQQDDLRLLLRDKPDQRYRQLLRLLGLEVLEQFERHLRARQKEARTVARDSLVLLDKHRSRASELSEEADTITALIGRNTADQNVGPDLDSLTDALTTLDVDVHQLETSGQWAALRAEALELSQHLASLVPAIEGIAEEEFPAPTAGDSAGQLEVATREHESAESAVRGLLREREMVQQAADALNQLAQLAIPQLQNADANEDGLVACPVCLTAVEREGTVQSLTSRAQVGSMLAAVDARLRVARFEESSARQHLAAIEQLERDLAVHEQNARRMEEDARMIAHELDALQSGTTISVRGLAEIAASRPNGAIRSSLLRNRRRILELLRAAQDDAIRLGTIADTGWTRLRASEASMANASQLPQVQARLETATVQVAERQREYDRARRDSAAATALLDAATDGIEQIFRDRFQGLEPIMNDIYGRLDPHPTFTRLDFQIETYNGRGTATATVTDEDEDVRGNPLLIFSSAQANIVALSAFLALGWAARDSGLPFVLMDDPLQSLDDVNVLGFSDLMRQVRRGRQVILSTHEERFARVMERKLVGRSPDESLIVHRFVGWGRPGPKFETRYLQYSPLPSLQVVNS